MSPPSPIAFGPALAGYAFQQTALVAMLPLLVERFEIPSHAIGGAVACGMLAAAATLPVVGARAHRSHVRTALWVMLVTSGMMAALIAAPPPGGAVLLLPLLAATRLAQGVAAATLLISAQSASIDAPVSPRRSLALAQSWAVIGRGLSAALIGPMLAVSAILPMFPAAFGAVFGLTRFPRIDWTPLASPRAAAPEVGALAIPMLVSGCLGSAQIALAPLLETTSAGAATAAGQTGMCLAAASLGHVAAHRWLAPEAGARTARVAAGCLAASIMAMPLASGTLALVAVLSAVAGGAAGLVLTGHLFTVLTRSVPGVRRSAAGWHATAISGGMALGVAIGSASMALGPVALPFLAAGGLALPLVVLHRQWRTI